MHSDAFFTGCQTHPVCQDYARAGRTPSGRVYAVVADGCSSSPDTDFGARFLTMAAVQSIGMSRHVDENVIHMAYPPPADMSPYCMDSTLIAAFDEDFLGEDGVSFRGFGDGLVLWRTVEGHVTVKVVSYPSGAPGYLTYLLDPERMRAYLDGGHGRRETETWVDGKFRTLGLPGGKSLADADVEEIKDGAKIGWGFSLASKNLDLAMVMTDGVHSFRQHGDGEPIPFLEVVNRLLDIKSFAGEFVQRRAKRFMQSSGWRNMDDFSVAAIRFERPA